jgi:toxin FitB
VSFLLDTVILSELRKKDRHPGVVQWVQSTRASDLFISVVTIGEIEKGISKQKIVNPDFANTLISWLETVLRVYQDRILPIDVSIARNWGQLSNQHGNQGADLLIAATALEHGLSVVTRNIRDFEKTGVPLINPFESTMPSA